MKVTQKILMVYLVGFVLFAGFAILTVLSGQQIQKTTEKLAHQEVPGLIALSAYKTHLQRQTIQLYELYATADSDSFEGSQQKSNELIAPHLETIKQLPQYGSISLGLKDLSKQQGEVKEKFASIMRQSSVDWDGARAVLAEFSQVSEKIDVVLDALVKEVSEDAEIAAKQSNKQTSTLIQAALVLTIVSVIFGILAAYFSHKKIAAPLKEVSDGLAGAAARKDLTYRVKQYGDDEVGAIATAANNLLDEFQRLAKALDSSTQKLNRTAKDLITASDEIHQDIKSSQSQLGNIKVISGKLQGLAEALQAQFRLLNF